MNKYSKNDAKHFLKTNKFSFENIDEQNQRIVCRFIFIELSMINEIS